MELIVVIVILAILAAILIPGLLKWIDQAKDKKYELEAREIALAVEAAMAKEYVESSYLSEGYDGGQLYCGDTTPNTVDFMYCKAFRQELKKFTDADVRAVSLWGSGWNASEPNPRSWDGNLNGFDIYFVSSDRVNIRAYYMSGSEVVYNGTTYHTPTNGWEIEKNLDFIPPATWPE